MQALGAACVQALVAPWAVAVDGALCAWILWVAGAAALSADGGVEEALWFILQAAPYTLRVR